LEINDDAFFPTIDGVEEVTETGIADFRG